MKPTQATMQEMVQPGPGSVPDHVELTPGMIYTLKPLSNNLTKMLGLEGEVLMVQILGNGNIQLHNTSLREEGYPVNSSQVNISYHDGVYKIDRSGLLMEVACDLSENKQYVIDKVRQCGHTIIAKKLVTYFQLHEIAHKTELGFMVADQFRRGNYFVVINIEGENNLFYTDFERGHSLLKVRPKKANEDFPEAFMHASLDVMVWLSEREIICKDHGHEEVRNSIFRTVLPRLVAGIMNRIDKIGEITDEQIKTVYTQVGLEVQIKPFCLYVFKKTVTGQNILQVNTCGEFLDAKDVRYYSKLITENFWD